MIKITELDIEVEDISDFNDEASEIFTAFCEDLQAKGMYTPVDEGENWLYKEEGIQFLWNKEAATLIEAELKRLESIGVKYFGLTLDIDISSHMFRTP